MMTLLYALVALLIVSFVSWVYYVYARKDLERMRCYEYHFDSFNKNMRPLLQDKGTPLEVLEMLLFLNGRIGRRGESYFVLRSLLKSRNTDEKQLASNAVMEVLAPFAAARPELHKAFIAAGAHALMAVSYQSILVGALLRRVVFLDIMDDTERAPRLTVRIQKAEGKSTASDGLAAA